mgnify:CR=1 FL=1
MNMETITNELKNITNNKDLEQIYAFIHSFVSTENAHIEYNKYYADISAEQYALQSFCLECEEKYFDDMILATTSIMGDIVDIAYEQFDFIPLGIEYAALRFFIVNTNDFLGCFYRYERKIEIDQKSLQNKSVILHELIHFYEWQLENTFPVAKELLTIRLYRNLAKTIDNLDTLIESHCDLFDQEETFNNTGNHGLLFYLKSLDLDIRCGYTLGTVCGYGRDE